MTVLVSIDGDKELTKAFNDLVKLGQSRDARKVLRSSLRKAGKPILTRVKAKAAGYTGPGNDTQNMLNLSRGIKLRAIKRSRRWVGVKIVTPTREALGIPAGSKWYFPAHVEYGTKTSPAFSYLRSTLDEMRTRSRRIFRVEMWRGLRRIGTGRK